MGTIDDINQMRSQGMTEEQIVSALQGRGLSYRDISEALTQSNIKAAVEAPSASLVGDAQVLQQNYAAQGAPIQDEAVQVSQSAENYPQDQFQGMEQSIMQTAQQPEADVAQYPSYEEYQYEPYEYGGGAVSTDTISEITEQIFSEKFSEIRKAIEKIIDFKTSMDVKTQAIDERLRRIEKIIDILQADVLKKVGDYVSDITDIKKEMVETQKSFAKLVEMKREKQGLHSRSMEHHEHEEHKRHKHHKEK